MYNPREALRRLMESCPNLSRLLGQEARLYVLCDHNEMARKAAGKPYHLPLSRWHTCLDELFLIAHGRRVTLSVEADNRRFVRC